MSCRYEKETIFVSNIIGEFIICFKKGVIPREYCSKCKEVE